MPRKFHALKLMEALLAEQLTNQITFLKLYINLGVINGIVYYWISRTYSYVVERLITFARSRFSTLRGKAFVDRGFRIFSINSTNSTNVNKNNSISILSHLVEHGEIWK